MSQINRPPTGLQQLLGSQNFGVNPDNLARDVMGVVNLYPFYAAQTLRKAENIGARSTTGEVCRIPFFGDVALLGVGAVAYNGVPTANELIMLSIGLGRIPGNNPTNVAPIWSNDVNNAGNVYQANAEVRWAYMLPQPLHLPAETDVVLNLDRYSGAALQLRLTAFYHDLSPGEAT